MNFQNKTTYTVTSCTSLKILKLIDCVITWLTGFLFSPRLSHLSTLYIQLNYNNQLLEWLSCNFNELGTFNFQTRSTLLEDINKNEDDDNGINYNTILSTCSKNTMDFIGRQQQQYSSLDDASCSSFHFGTTVFDDDNNDDRFFQLQCLTLYMTSPPSILTTSASQIT
ncbi:unnamed protein product [Cunninghamella echinulata]